MRQPSPTDRAYTAGYFDGDGSYDFGRRAGYWRTRIGFGQTQPEGLQFLQGIYGGNLRPKRTKPPRRWQLAYDINRCAAVTQFLADVQPFSIERRQEIDLLVKYFKPGMTEEEGQHLRDALDTIKSCS